MARPSQSFTATVYHAPAFSAAEAGALFLASVLLFIAITVALPIGLATLVVAQLVGLAGLPLLLVVLRRQSLASLGLGRPALRHLLGAALFGATFWYASLYVFAPLIEALDRGELRRIERDYLADHDIAVRLVAIGLVPAVCEELVTRGVLARSFAPLSARLAVAVSATAFAALHLAPSRVAPMLAFGAVLAVFAVSTRTIWPAIVAHFTNNAVVLLWDAGALPVAPAFVEAHPIVALVGALITSGAGIALVVRPLGKTGDTFT